MNTPAAVPATQKPRELAEYLSSPTVVSGISAVAGKYLRPERLLKIVINCLRKVPALGQCDKQSFLGAVMTLASLELEPNTPQGHAYLIPYQKRGKDPQTGKWGVVGTECQLVIGYRGLIELAYRNPNIVSLRAHAIHQNDKFEYFEDYDAHLRWQPAMTDRGPLIGAYAIARYRTAAGAEATLACVLPLEEVHKARSKSETYNFLVKQAAEADSGWKKESAEKKLAETPWVMWEDDMAAKTAIRKLSKVLPIGGNFASAAAADEAAESGTIDFAAMQDVSVAQSLKDGDGVPTVEHEDESPQAAALPSPTEKPFVVEGTHQREAAPVVASGSAGPVEATTRPRGGKAAQAQRTEPPPAHDPQTGEIYEDGAPPHTGDGLNFG
jgi:recombination protein RecT